MISFLGGGQDHFVRKNSNLKWIVPYHQGISHLLLQGILHKGCLSFWTEKDHDEILGVVKLFYAQNH